MSLGAPLLFVVAYVYFLQFLTVILVSEKETLVKQHMLMMGMRETAYWYSCYHRYHCLFLNLKQAPKHYEHSSCTCSYSCACCSQIFENSLLKMGLIVIKHL